MIKSNPYALHDLTGQIFGLWSVIKRTYDPSRPKYTMWLCRCACGTEKNKSSQDLKKSVVTNGGCYECLPKRSLTDLSGQTIGKWKVLEWDPNSVGQPKWKCLCTGCDIEYSVFASSLLNGGSVQCKGCAGNNFVDLKGQMFGKWKILYHIKKSEWMCQCIGCAKEQSVDSSTLRFGRSKGCRSCAGGDLIDLTGRTFGKWQVIKLADRAKKHTMWVCLCSGCGLEFNIGQSSLANGRSSGCNLCNIREKGRLKRKDLTGQKFGLWTALRYNEDTRKWICQCKGCKHEYEVKIASLQDGSSKGCCNCSAYKTVHIETERFGTLPCQGYEKQVLRFFDSYCPDIKSVERCKRIKIAGRPICPDFLITKKSGKQTVVEVKSIWTYYGTHRRDRSSYQHPKYLDNKHRYSQLRKWCRRNDCDFVLWCINDKRSFKQGLTKFGYSANLITSSQILSLS